MGHGKFDSVWLLRVPDYNQGTHDGLCTYYSCAMLLATLFPEYEASFGEGRARRRVGLDADDPLIKHHPINDSYKALSRWFLEGEYVSTGCEILNRIVGNSRTANKLFNYEDRNRVDGTFDEIAASIDRGLPVVIGWNSDDFGDHTVLVRGYRRGGRLRWLIVNDPGGDVEIAWESLGEATAGRLSVIFVNHGMWLGPRPDRLVQTRGESRVDRWWFNDQGDLEYQPVNDLFARVGASHAIVSALKETPEQLLTVDEIVDIVNIEESAIKPALRSLVEAGRMHEQGSRPPRFRLRT